MNNRQTIHVIYNAEDLGERLTMDDKEARRALRAGKTVDLNESTVVAALETSLSGWTEKLGDREWRAVAPEWLMELSRPVDSGISPDELPIYSGVPVDLPYHLAAKRLKRLDHYAGPQDMRARVELTEIVMATRSARLLNLFLFSDQSLACPSFHVPDTDSLRTLKSDLHKLDGIIEQLQERFRGDIGLGNPVSQDGWLNLSRDLAIKSQSLNELAYLINDTGTASMALNAFHDSWLDLFDEDVEEPALPNAPFTATQ